MRNENMKIGGVLLNVQYTADGAIGDPPVVTIEHVFAGHDDIFDLLSEQIKDEIVEALFVLRGEMV